MNTTFLDMMPKEAKGVRRHYHAARLALLMGSIALMTPTAAMAQSQNQTDIEQTLKNIVNFLTGPIASFAAVIGIVICGYLFLTGNANKSVMVSVIGGIIIIFSAAWIVSKISGTTVS